MKEMTFGFYCERDHEIRFAYPECVVMIWDGEIEQYSYSHLAPPFNTFVGYVDFMRKMSAWVEFMVPDATDP